MVSIVVASGFLQRRAIDRRPQPLVLLPLLIDLEISGAQPVSRTHLPQPDELGESHSLFSPASESSSLAEQPSPAAGNQILSVKHRRVVLH